MACFFSKKEAGLISSHNRYSMAHVIEKHIEFYAESETSGRRPVALPPVFVDHFLNWRDSAMPEVEGVMTAPLVLPDGTLLAPVGLDRDRKLVFRIEPALLKLLPKPDECTPEACGEALDFLINTWLVDVTTDFIGRCNLVAEAMTILERVLFPERPAWFITAGKRGGGKTTAQTMVVLAATGKKPPAAAWSPSLEERRKAMFAYLSEGLAALVWDNIPLGTVISCPVLESVLTTDHWTDRQLSVSKTPIVQAFTVMAFTGNNVGPGGDLASRVLKVDLVVDRVDPENRTFTHPDPIAWTLDHRGEILRALYTIMLGNKQLKAGPDAQQSTRFKAWWRLVGSAIENAAVAMMAAQTGQELDETVKRAEAIDYNDVFKTVEDTDEVAASVSDVLEALYIDMKSYGRTAFEAAHISELVNGIETDEHVQALRQFIDPSGRKIGSITAKSVGWRLKTIVGTPVVVGDKVMTLKPMDAGSKRALLYQIVTSKKL